MLFKLMKKAVRTYVKRSGGFCSSNPIGRAKANFTQYCDKAVRSANDEPASPNLLVTLKIPTGAKVEVGEKSGLQ